MYIDLIVLLVLFILVVMYFNRFHSFVFFIAIVDIFLRIATFVKENIPMKDISNLIGKYLPESIPNIIDNYTSNWEMVNLILRWGYVIIMTIFLYYIIKIFWKKTKI